MESQTLSDEKPTNKNRTIIIVVAVIVVLCCCLVIVAAVGFYAFTNISSVQTDSGPIEPIDEFVPPSNSMNDTPPGGGLANDILKNDTWQVLAPGAASFGCDEPSGSGLTIEVLQQPDAGGVWVEKWPVKCSSGEILEFEVEFMLDDTGATFNIKLMQE